MRELLTICATPSFEFDGQNYVQVEGVSMDSPLGTLFADFYVLRLENKLLHENKVSNPRYYKRYVDELIAFFLRPSHVNWSITCLQRGSVLKFTHEDFPNHCVHFLDISFTIEENIQRPYIVGLLIVALVITSSLTPWIHIKKL